MIREQKRLKEILKEREITAYKLAKVCGISPSNMYTMLSGDIKAFPKWRKAISEYLGMSEADIFED
jgi:predicted transcriptional regulator